MKKKILLGAGVFSFLISISQDSSYTPKYSVVFGADKGKGLFAQCSRSTPEKATDFWKPSDSNIKSLEQNFKKLLNLVSSGCCIARLKIDKLESYGLQYTGVTIGKKRYIYINAFPLNTKGEIGTFNKNWNTDPLIVCDGGSGYWGVLFSVDDMEFRQLNFNGMA